MKNFRELLKQRYLLLQFIHLLRYIILELQLIVQLQKVFEVQRLMELHQFHLIQHHLQFRLGLRPQFQSASAAPVGLQSSPGGMSDVGSTLTPPGLPLKDPPRMAGSYGVSLNDPVFGISSGSIPCENPGHRPIPAQTSPSSDSTSTSTTKSWRSSCTVACGAGCNEPSFDSNGTGDEL